MLIPSIDLKGGRVVQLIQGERPALATDDIELWISRFKGFPHVQLIDLDAAMGTGTNDDLLRHVAAVLPCRVGGGIRTIERAREVLEYGAEAVIIGSSLFQEGKPNIDFATKLSSTIGHHRIIAAVDSMGGGVVIKGWTVATSLTAVDAVRAVEPFCG